MKAFGNWKLISAVILCSLAVLFPTLATTQEKPDAGEKAISARQGFMQVVVWEAGPLFGMAKGEIPYDPEMATSNAGSLDALVQYPVDRLFIPDTSKSDRPGKTRALADIWEEPDKFREAYEDFRTKAAAVAREAGKGRDALTAAVQEMGKTCGNCHDSFRAEDF